MAVTVDELFKRDLDDILKDAEELLKDDNPDTKAFVTTQITDLQAILKQKQLETEQQLQKEIDEEEKEIESMKERIKKLQAGGVEDSTDEALDHMKLWKDLKDNEWKEVFGFFIRETSEQVPIIHERLIKILKIAYETAGDKMRVSRAQIVYQVMQPGAVFEMEIKQAWKAPEPKEEELYELSSQCQFKAMPFCIDAIKKNIRDAIVDEHKKLCTVPDASDAFNKALDYYFLKCIEFSWAAAFEEKLPILLVTDPQKECPKLLLNNFQGLDNLRKLCTLEWPALVQGNSIICPWVLKERNQLRPTASPYTKDELLNVGEDRPEHGRTVESQSQAEMTSPQGRPLPKPPQVRPLPQPPETKKESKSQKETIKQPQTGETTAQNVNSKKKSKIHGNMRNHPNVNF